MDKIIPGLVMAAFSALTFVAYKHPVGYQRLAKPIRYISVALFCSAVIWDMGSMRTLSNIYQFIDAAKINEARVAAENTQFMSGYIFAAYFAGLLYLEFLGYLPEILGDDKPPKEKR